MSDKILILVFHPNLGESIVNRSWINLIKMNPDKFDLYDVYKEYPKNKIDIKKEQDLIERYDKIIFQFPFYWFNCPPLFKQWLDEVLTYGWAYGSKSGFKIKNKKVSLAISIGIEEKEYSSNGLYKYSMKELLSPYEITFQYVKANYVDPFLFFGIENDISEKKVQESNRLYFEYLTSF